MFEGYVGPAWSPDGSQIAFTSDRARAEGLYVMNADGRDIRRLIARQCSCPAWSPDGTRIAFHRYRDGLSDGYVDICLLDVRVDTSLFRRRTRGGRVRRLTGPGWDLNPAWSPDSRHLAFMSTRNGDWNIYVMDADGGKVRQLTADSGGNGSPGWSPDGTQIAFESHSDRHVYVMEADGGNIHRLEDKPYDGWCPSWSPDGTQLVFVSGRDSGPAIYVINQDGGQVQRLTDGPNGGSGPVWSPDGSKIAFFEQDPDTDFDYAIYVMRADGSNVRRIAPR